MRYGCAWTAKDLPLRATQVVAMDRDSWEVAPRAYTTSTIRKSECSSILTATVDCLSSMDAMARIRWVGSVTLVVTVTPDIDNHYAHNPSRPCSNPCSTCKKRVCRFSWDCSSVPWLQVRSYASLLTLQLEADDLSQQEGEGPRGLVYRALVSVKERVTEDLLYRPVCTREGEGRAEEASRTGLPYYFVHLMQIFK